MESVTSGFNLLKRGFSKTLVLIAGWATDYRIFNTLNLEFNYLIAHRPSPFNFSEELLGILKENNLKKISLFGWSMGGFLAFDFATKYPEKIEELILVSVRRQYEKESIERIKTSLRKNRQGYLYKFYQDCFSEREKEAFFWFKENLFKSYLREMKTDLLLEGLDYLLRARIGHELLKGLGLRFIHGKLDKIAPIEEIFQLTKSLPKARFISLQDRGHLPFLHPDFKKIFYASEHK